MKKRLILVTNEPINFYVEQDFPVVERELCGQIYKSVQVIANHGKDKPVECDYFTVEVVKDYEGFVSFIVYGKPIYKLDVESTVQRFGIQILRTEDFNRAYDLKNKLDTLIGGKPSEQMKMHCYGSLQREQLWWEKEQSSEKKEITPFNDLLIQSSSLKPRNSKKEKNHDPER